MQSCDAPSMRLAGAVRVVVDILRARPASGGDGPDNWERIVRIIAEHDNLPDSEVKVIGKASRKRTVAGRASSVGRSGVRPMAA